MEALRRKYPNSHRILIEDAANGPAIIDALRQFVAGIVAVHPEGGKLARAQAVQPRVEAGNVYLPNPRPLGTLIPERTWVDDLLYQLTVFPNGAHDDDVDAFTQLLVRWLQHLQSRSAGANLVTRLLAAHDPRVAEKRLDGRQSCRSPSNGA